MLSEIEKHCLQFFDEYYIYSLNETANERVPLSTRDFFINYYSTIYLKEQNEKNIFEKIGNIFNPSCMSLF